MRLPTQPYVEPSGTQILLAEFPNTFAIKKVDTFIAKPYLKDVLDRVNESSIATFGTGGEIADCVRFTLEDDSEIYMEAIGDCCSQSWFQAIDKNETLFDEKKFVGKRIQNQKRKRGDPYPDDAFPRSDVDDIDQVHRYHLWFDSGSDSAVVSGSGSGSGSAAESESESESESEPDSYEFIFWNSSNGYYEGWIEFYRYENKGL